MAGLDTNVLVRWLVDDDAAQSALAAERFRIAARQQQPLFVPVTVTLELEWVLRSRYRYAKADIQRAFNALLETRELLFQSEDAIERALHAWRNGNADFADCLHAGLCIAAGHAPLMIFIYGPHGSRDLNGWSEVSAFGSPLSATRISSLGIA